MSDRVNSANNANMDKTILDLIDKSLKAPQKSPEWLKQRHGILSSSEVASALDANLHESSMELLKRKCSPLSDADLVTSKSISWGEKYEPIAKKIFEEITNEKIMDVGLIIHSTIPWLGTSPDAIVLSKKLLEIKCPFHRHIIDGRIPYYYWIQTQMQMEVCDLDECYFLQCRFEENALNSTGHTYSGVHSDGTKWYLKKYTLNVIDRDRDWFARSLPMLNQFWNKVEHYRFHGLGKLVADMGGKQVYYNLNNNQLEVLTKSPSLLALQETRNPCMEEPLTLNLADSKEDLGLPDTDLVPQVIQREDNVSGDIQAIQAMQAIQEIQAAQEIHKVNTPVTVCDDDLESIEVGGVSSPVQEKNISPGFRPMNVNMKNWNEWVSATAIRNFLLNDPLLDWLDTYGKGSNNLKTGNMLFDQRISEYEDDAKDVSVFNNYLQAQGLRFEDEVFAYLNNNYPKDIITIANPYQARQSDKVQETLDAMQEGIHIIYQAVLHNNSNKTYGIADLLVRSDFVNRMFSHPVLDSHTQHIGCKLNAKWHYLVIDIKHITLGLRADSIHLLNQGSVVAYKGQVCIYNDALAEIQGYKPKKAFILGRKWTYTTKGTIYAGNGWFDRLGEIDFETVDNDITSRTAAAIEWITLVRSEGARWSIDPPSRVELYPNMCNDSDAPWHSTKKEIAMKIGEITQVYYAGINHRNAALAKGITSWRDDRCTAAALGHNGPKIAPIIDAILDINRSTDKIRYGDRNIKIPDAKVRFYIDFETINDIVEDIKSDRPITTTQSYIFMIGIGWKVRGKPGWNYRCLTANTIDSTNEKEIFLSMHDNMLEIIETNDAFENCTVFHWSHAEKTFYDHTAEKYLDDLGQYSGYLNWEWYDLCKLFTSTPITVRGALTFSLKDIAPAMYRHGFIQTNWAADGILDGLNAMIKAAECSEDAKKKGISMTELPVMKRIIEYNEVDCKVMMEIVEFISNDLHPAPSSKYMSKITRKNKRTISEVITNEWHEIPTKKTKIMPEVLDDINELPKSTARLRKRKIPDVQEETQSNSKEDIFGVEEPQIEEPQIEEPQIEEPQIEEPQIEEPQVEEPQVEEPQVEEVQTPSRKTRKRLCRIDDD